MTAMPAERFTPEAVRIAQVEFDEQDRAIIGHVVLNFGGAGVLAALHSPRDWEVVAGYLYALLEREPLKSGRGYLAHRTIIHGIAQDLRAYAMQAGEPVGLQADLRHAQTKAEERRTLELIEAREAARQALIDERQERLRDDIARGEALVAQAQQWLDDPMSGSVVDPVSHGTGEAVGQGLPPGKDLRPGPVPVTDLDIDDPDLPGVVMTEDDWAERPGDDLREEPAEHTEQPTETNDDWLL